MTRVFLLAGLCLLLGMPADARCTNYASLATFDARRHTTDRADFDDGKAITRLVVETAAGLLPVQVSSPRNADQRYFRDGAGKPMPISVSIEKHACKEGGKRLFTRKYFRKLPMDPPFPFAAPLGSPASAPDVEALARTILASTYCKGGEIGLNRNKIYLDERGAKPKPGVLVPAVQLLGPGYGDVVWSVLLTCSIWRERA